MRSHLVLFVLLLSLVSSPLPGFADSRATLPEARTVETPSERVLLEAPEQLAAPFEKERRLFLEGSAGEVSRALGKLVAAGESGVAEAARLIASIEDADLRGKRQVSLRGRVQRQLGSLLAEDDLAGAQTWLRALAAGGHPDARRELATFLALTGQAKATLDDPLLEAWRLRAAGEPVAARDLLDRSQTRGEQATELRIALAFDLEDWSALGEAAWQRAGEGGERERVHLGLAVAAFRAADDPKRAELVAVRLDQLLRKQALDPADAAVVLLLDDQAEAALPLLREAGEPSTAFNLLSSEWDYGAALELAAEAVSRDDLPAKERVKLEARVARLLAALTDPEGAKKAVEAHALWSAKDRSPALAAAGTIGLELRLGLDESARSRAAEALESLKEGEHPRTILGALFPQTRSEAELVWTHVSERYPEESRVQRLARSEKLLTAGEADPAELSALMQRERERAAELDRADQARWYRGLAGLAERHGNESLALELAEDWNAVEQQRGARTELAERQAQAGDWALAAETWLEAYRDNPGEPGPLALAGWAMSEAGWPKAGEELKLQASLVALGDGGRRYRLAGLYEKYSLFEDADRERKILFRTQAPSSWAYGATLRLLAGHASCAGATASAARWATPTHLQSYLQRDRTSPGLAHHWARTARDARVLRAVEQGDADAALGLAAESLGPWLRDLDVTAEALGRLEAEGFAGEAEHLSWRLLDRLREVSEGFPGSASHAHAHAALAADTERDLDAALLTATRAVELRPKACSYRSTLAEVLSTRGDIDEALVVVREALASCPNAERCPSSERLAQQLQRLGEGEDSQTTSD